MVRYRHGCVHLQTQTSNCVETYITLNRCVQVVGYKFESVVGSILLLLNTGLWMLGYRHMPVALRTELLFMPAKDTDPFWAAHWRCESSVNKRVFFFKKENKRSINTFWRWLHMFIETLINISQCVSYSGWKNKIFKHVIFLKYVESWHYKFIFMGRFQTLKITPNFGVSDGQESAWHEDLSSIPELGRSPGEGNGNTLQHSCLENSMDRGAWQVTVHGVTESRTRLRTNSL